jgi:acetyl esterase/lipase
METIPLYPGLAPGSEDWNYAEIEEAPSSSSIGGVRNVTRPVLIPYFPDPSTANGTAVIICPGGAFHGLAIYHEGHDVARWLQERGVAAFVLKYRVVHTPEDKEVYAAQDREVRSLPFEENKKRIDEVTREARKLGIADGLRAIQLVRERASEWNISPDRIGIMGFSAGGYVTGYAALNYDPTSRPNFAAPIYPALVSNFTVPQDAPPLFIAVTGNDEIAVAPSLELFSAWKASGHPAELHIYANGDHGFGMLKKGLPLDGWIDSFWAWLQCNS